MPVPLIPFLTIQKSLVGGPLVNRMLPEPPPLAGAAHEWTANELFWIVKNGIKYTGMPPGRGGREDEVWPWSRSCSSYRA